MRRCCVCNKKGSVLVNGLWWCEKHVEYTSGEIKRVVGLGTEGGHVNLDLAWV